MGGTGGQQQELNDLVAYFNKATLQEDEVSKTQDCKILQLSGAVS